MELWASLIVPAILIVFGLFTRVGLPKRVNFFVGYRTSMACKNQDTWAFAHKHAGKLWIIIGFILLALSVGVALIDSEAHEWITLAIVVVQVVAIVLTIIPTEIALRKEFDKNGNRR